MTPPKFASVNLNVSTLVEYHYTKYCIYRHLLFGTMRCYSYLWCLLFIANKKSSWLFEHNTTFKTLLDKKKSIGKRYSIVDQQIVSETKSNIYRALLGGGQKI